MEKFERQIRKTGFDLEHRVATLLKAAGWAVISNKFYLDDYEESVREIDMVAYRVGKVGATDMYTTLIISCKKSEANTWALLSREINVKDPNSDWWPLHAWSNDKALSYQLSQPDAGVRYHEQVAALGDSGRVLGVPEAEVFAFQEMDSKSGSPQNDKPIFTSITSLMKAQAYELSALPLRKKKPSIYQFNLLSVVDAPLIRLMFKGDEIKGSSVDSETYIARYIVKKRETFSRIRFVRAASFEDKLNEYGALHNANLQWFESQRNEFYSDAVEDWDKRQVFAEDFAREIKWFLEHKLFKEFGEDIDLPSPALYWSGNERSLSVTMPLTDEQAAYLNEDDEVLAHVAGKLKKFYRYEGEFKFVDDIPF